VDPLRGQTELLAAPGWAAGRGGGVKVYSLVASCLELAG